MAGRFLFHKFLLPWIPFSLPPAGSDPARALGGPAPDQYETWDSSPDCGNSGAIEAFHGALGCLNLAGAEGLIGNSGAPSWIEMVFFRKPDSTSGGVS